MNLQVTRDISTPLIMAIRHTQIIFMNQHLLIVVFYYLKVQKLIKKDLLLLNVQRVIEKEYWEYLQKKNI